MSGMNNIKDGIKPMSKEDAAKRRKSSMAIALVLAMLMVLFYAVTLIQFGKNRKEMVDALKKKGEQHKMGRGILRKPEKVQPVPAPQNPAEKNKE